LVPSAELAAEYQKSGATLFDVHVPPPLVEVQIGPRNCPPPATARRFVPSAELATENHPVPGTVLETQVAPESVDVNIPLPPAYAAAIKCVPSADEATANHSPDGTLLDVHEAPEFVEVYIPLAYGITATNFVPSAEDATACQSLVGEKVFVQVWPNTEAPEKNKNAPASIDSRKAKSFIGSGGFLAKILQRLLWMTTH
jgi:hypothetical protein